MPACSSSSSPGDYVAPRGGDSAAADAGPGPSNDAAADSSSDAPFDSPADSPSDALVDAGDAGDAASAWTVTTQGAQDLFSAWASGANDVYVVGDRGTVFHSANNGSSWQPVSIGAYIGARESAAASSGALAAGMLRLR